MLYGIEILKISCISLFKLKLSMIRNRQIWSKYLISKENQLIFIEIASTETKSIAQNYMIDPNNQQVLLYKGKYFWVWLGCVIFSSYEDDYTLTNHYYYMQNLFLCTRKNISSQRKSSSFLWTSSPSSFWASTYTF